MKREILIALASFGGGVGASVGGYFAYQHWQINISPEAIAMREVRQHLFDPESARFENVQHNTATKATCGRVNAKNKMGGYVGFARFILKPDGRLDMQPPNYEDAADKDKLDAAEKQLAFLKTIQALCNLE